MKSTIRKVLRGDAESYRKIIDEYATPVRLFIAGRLHDHQHVDDLVQEVFVSAWKSLKRYNPENCFQSWLMTIAHRKLIDHLRSHYRKEKLKLGFEEELQRRLKATAVPSGEVIDRMHHCLEKLPESSRKLIRQRYFEGAGVLHIASRDQRSENAVSSRLFRIRIKLKECIEKND